MAGSVPGGRALSLPPAVRALTRQLEAERAAAFPRPATSPFWGVDGGTLCVRLGVSPSRLDGWGGQPGHEQGTGKLRGSVGRREGWERAGGRAWIWEIQQQNLAENSKRV